MGIGDWGLGIGVIRKGLNDIDRLTPEAMKEQYGFSPKQIIDFKGLRGDSSDNLPGIPGIGDKTAVKLIGEYGDFNSIVEAAKDGRIKGKIGQSIVENEEIGRTCYRLATILIDANLPFSPDSLEYDGYSFSDINAFCQKYELRQLPSRLPTIFKKKDDNVLPRIQSVDILPKISSSSIGLASMAN